MGYGYKVRTGNKREMLEEYLMGLFPDERIEGIADAIESIYKEVTHE